MNLTIFTGMNSCSERQVRNNVSVWVKFVRKKLARFSYFFLKETAPQVLLRIARKCAVCNSAKMTSDSATPHVLFLIW